MPNRKLSRQHFSEWVTKRASQVNAETSFSTENALVCEVRCFVGAKQNTKWSKHCDRNWIYSSKTIFFYFFFTRFAENNGTRNIKPCWLLRCIVHGSCTCCICFRRQCNCNNHNNLWQSHFVHKMKSLAIQQNAFSLDSSVQVQADFPPIGQHDCFSSISICIRLRRDTNANGNEIHFYSGFDFQLLLFLFSV